MKVNAVMRVTDTVESMLHLGYNRKLWCWQSMCNGYLSQ